MQSNRVPSLEVLAFLFLIVRVLAIVTFASWAHFLCSQWSTPRTGALAGAFLIEEAPQAGDTANLLRMSE